MTKDKFGQLVLDENDLVDLVMSKRNTVLDGVLVSEEFLERVRPLLESVPDFKIYNPIDVDQQKFDKLQQDAWLMPDEIQKIDIAEYILNLCNNEAELQRCGAELLMYQERNLFDLLKYLHYLCQVMKSNNIIWGVGRGSSVASFVLYKLGVHRVDSLFYELDPSEFLR